MRIICIALCSIGIGGNADAYCFDPSFSETEPYFAKQAPEAPSTWEKPDVPYCLNTLSYSGQHSCSEWEIDNYLDEVKEYISSLRSYAEETLEFAKSAQTFAEEAEYFAQEAVDYYGEVIDYANCEAEEVNSQHE